MTNLEMHAITSQRALFALFFDKNGRALSHQSVFNQKVTIVRDESHLVFWRGESIRKRLSLMPARLA